MLLDRTPACGYILRSTDCTVFFSGDTGYGTFLKDIGSRFSIDIALLPIGAYKPYKWFKNIHLHPTTALQAFLDLNARHLIPIHWGTFKISDEPLAEPPLLLAKEAERLGVQDRVHILPNGGDSSCNCSEPNSRFATVQREKSETLFLASLRATKDSMEAAGSQRVPRAESGCGERCYILDELRGNLIFEFFGKSLGPNFLIGWNAGNFH
jgi:hypothetical protein